MAMHVGDRSLPTPPPLPRGVSAFGRGDFYVGSREPVTGRKPCAPAVVRSRLRVATSHPLVMGVCEFGRPLRLRRPAITIRLVFPNLERPDALLDTGVYRIGAGADADFRFLSPTMPSVAAEIHVSGRYVDLYPRAGAEITMNGRRIGNVVALRNGDRLQVAGVAVRLEKILAGPGPLAANDSVARYPDVPRMLDSLPVYVLRCVSGPNQGRVYPVAGGVTIGRDPLCQIVLNAPFVSRRHACLKLTVQGVIVEDLGSKNGIHINDRPARNGILRPGDELRLAGIAFLFCTQAQVERAAAAQAVDARATFWQSHDCDWFTLGLLGIFGAFLIAVSVLVAQ